MTIAKYATNGDALERGNSAPDACLLSNGHYNVLVTLAGSGYSAVDGIDVTRWREDVTCKSWGQYCFVRDLDERRVWSAGRQPLGATADRYEAELRLDRANLRILEVSEIKSVPYVPLSHPFVERLIGTIRREYLDRILFWTTADLEAKLIDLQQYYNGHRTHAGLEGRLPEPPARGTASPTGLDSYRWRRHCRGLYQTPIAA